MSEAAAAGRQDGEVVNQIRRLQRDGLVLIAHLAEATNRRLVDEPGQAEPPQQADPGPDQADLGLLVLPPGDIAADGAQFTRLVRTVDRLSRSAAPATAGSIRFTAAYHHGRSGRPDGKGARVPGRAATDDPGGPALYLTDTELRRARGVRRELWVIRSAMIVAMLTAVWLLMHVDNGRRILTQRGVVETGLEKAYSDLAKLDPKQDFRLQRVPPEPDGMAAGPVTRMVLADATPVTGGGPGMAPPGAANPPAEDPLPEFCWSLPAGGAPEQAKAPVPGSPAPAGPAIAGLRGADQRAGAEPSPAKPEAATDPEFRLLPRKIPAQNLCSHLIQLKLREALGYTRLADWNCVQVLMNPLNATEVAGRWVLGWFSPAYASGTHPCMVPPLALAAPAGPDDWRRTELRMQDGLVMLTGYILPLLLGGIGSAVYVMRRFEQKLRDATLSANDGTAGVGRVMLGATCGGLIGLLFGTEGPVEIGGFNLALAAWAFFLGYGLETVLKALDTVIEATVRWLGTNLVKGKDVPVARSDGTASAT